MQRDLDESYRWRAGRTPTRVTQRGVCSFLIQRLELFTAPTHQRWQSLLQWEPPGICPARRPYSPASEACARLRVSRPSGPISICPRAARGASVGPGLGDSGVWTMAQPSSHAGSMQAWAPRKRSCVVFSGEDKHCPLTPLWCGSPLQGYLSPEPCVPRPPLSRLQPPGTKLLLARLPSCPGSAGTSSSQVLHPATPPGLPVPSLCSFFTTCGLTSSPESTGRPPLTEEALCCGSPTKAQQETQS